jgi:hypothetical protein
MPVEPKVPDKETLTRWWVDEGLTRQEIVDRQFEETGLKPTVQAISMAVSRYGLPAKRNRWDDLLPWRIKTEHVSLSEAKLLRLAGRRKAGLKNRPNLEKWLDGWLAELEEQGRPVVAYYADLAEPFQYHPRVPEDGDGEWDLIRKPEVQEELDKRKAS